MVKTRLSTVEEVRDHLLLLEHEFASSCDKLDSSISYGHNHGSTGEQLNGLRVRLFEEYARLALVRDIIAMMEN